MIELTFLGTSSAFPTIKRNHSSIYVKLEDKRLLLDCGEGTQRQIRIAGLSPKIDYILLTHWHVDHMIGIVGLLESLAISNLPMPQIFGPDIEKNATMLLRAVGLNEIVKINDVQLKGEKEIIDLEKFKIFAFPVKHTAPCIGYKIVEKDKVKIKKEFLEKNNIKSGPHLRPLLEGKDIIYEGRKISAKEATEIQRGKAIAYLTDLRFDKKIAKYIKNVDLLIIEATYRTELQKEAKEYYHLTIKDALTLAKMATAKQVIITHISQRYENSEDYRNEVFSLAQEMGLNVQIAEDFMTVKLE
jgi:ribonuclease Z